MKSRSNQTPTQNAAVNIAPGQTGSYAPSVPISVYRELAAELDATRALLETVHTENQQLQQQNQQLRQEIDRLVQSALSLRSYTESNHRVSNPVVAESIAPLAASAFPQGKAEANKFEENKFEDEFEFVAAQLRGTSASEPSVALQLPEGVIASTQVADLPQSLSSETKPKSLGGLWLTLTVVAVVIGAFGAGFFMVKPLLQNR